MDRFETEKEIVSAYLERVASLHRRYREGEIHVHIPAALEDSDLSLDELIRKCLPASSAALEAASRSLFFSLPVAFDPRGRSGPISPRWIAIPRASPIGSSTWAR